MTLDGLINKLISAGIEKSEAKKEISILLKELGENNLNKIETIVNERVKSRTPLQYLLGKAYFMDFEVRVDKRVLIPRPETEILVEETIRRMGMPRYVLDIGTGSGIISIALAKSIPNINIVAIDIEKDIINLAYENAKNNKVENKIKFLVCDIFSNNADDLFKENKFDLVISNPPYIQSGKYGPRSIPAQPERKHEPKIALYGTKENKTGMIYYERIVELCLSGSMPATLAFEIDPYLVNDLKSLLKKYDLNNFEIIKDYSGLDRCLFVFL